MTDPAPKHSADDDFDADASVVADTDDSTEDADVAPAEADDNQVTVKLVSPIYGHTLRVPSADGSAYLTITQDGTKVDADAVSAIQQAASEAGLVVVAESQDDTESEDQS